MSVRGWLFAWGYDRIMSATEQAGLGERRRDLLAAASGTVLEIGAGTGLNLPYYAAGVTSLTLTEPERPMLRRLERAAERSARATELVQAPAEELPFADGRFDTVVTTLTLCTVRDQPRALREIRRVLRPGGRLLFLEHVRGRDADTARLQDRMLRLTRFFGYGCHCNRDTLAAITAAGFSVDEVEHGELPNSPRWIRPMITGTATA